MNVENFISFAGGLSTYAAAHLATSAVAEWKRRIIQATAEAMEKRRIELEKQRPPQLSPEAIAKLVAAEIAPRIDAGNRQAKTGGHVAERFADSPATQDDGFDPFPKAKPIEHYNTPGYKVVTWRDHPSLVKLARELASALKNLDRSMKFGDCKTQVSALMEAHARPGSTFEELFPLLIRKVKE